MGHTFHTELALRFELKLRDSNKNSYTVNSQVLRRVYYYGNQLLSSSSHIRRVEISVKPRNFRQNLDVYQLLFFQL